MKQKKWKKFEQLAYEIQKSLSPDAEVKSNDKIMGADSKIPREIDISVRQGVGQYKILIAMECKDWAHPVDIKEIEAFIQKIKDIRANKGAFISYKGFTKSAVELARNHGLDTFRLVDVENKDWKAYASIPVLLIGHSIKSLSFSFSGFPYLPMPLVMASDREPFFRINCLDEKRQYIDKLRFIVANKWNKQLIPHIPGIHREIPINESRFIEYESQIIPCRLAVNVIVEEKRHLGHWPLVKLKGFADVQNGGVATREIITESLSFYEVESGKIQGWQPVLAEQDLAIKPFMHISYSDYVPENEKEEESYKYETKQDKL